MVIESWRLNWIGLSRIYIYLWNCSVDWETHTKPPSTWRLDAWTCFVYKVTKERPHVKLFNSSQLPSHMYIGNKAQIE